MSPRVVLALPLVLCACGDKASDVDPYDVIVGPYDATVRRTAYGIPHIEGATPADLAFGTGYAMAQDHICTIADQVVKVRSERARYFGLGDDNEHADSDFAWKALGVMSKAEAAWFDLPDDVQSALVGFSAGYNQHLGEVGPAGLPAPCRDAEWVKPVTHIDLFAHYLHLGQMGSGFYLLDYVATGAPPTDPSAKGGAEPPSLQEFGRRIYPRNGSNGLAVGAQYTETARGMLVSNSHFEAEGEKRWYEMHQTIPGELDVYGVALMGVPLVNMGFNEHVAWTHTVSTTPRFIIYQLELEPGDPTRYLYDGEYRDMEATEYTISVRGQDGSQQPLKRTLYRSHHGPMLNAPLVGWTGQVAFTYRDVNADNIEMIPAWWDMNRAESLDELAQAQARNGIPWVHTVAAGADGRVYYADSAATPNITPEAEAAYADYVSSNFLARQFKGEGAYVFDGGDPRMEWVDEGTTIPNVVPVERAPQLMTDTSISNSNENHWLTNNEERLEDYPMLFGEDRAPRQGRTKMGLRLLAGLDVDTDQGEDDRFSFAELEAAVLSYPAHHADFLLPQLVERCAGVELVTVQVGVEAVEVDVSEACAVLSRWDGSLRVDAVGAHVFREWMGSGEFQLGYLGPFVKPGDFDEAGKVYADAWNVNAPMITPNTLAPAPEVGKDPALQALAKAVMKLDEAGIALDAPLGDVQYREKFGVRTPCPGGKEMEGSLLIADWRGANSTLLPREHTERGPWLNPRTELTADGYPVNGGDSWVAAIAFTDDGPEARAVMTYSNSSDPDSPHANDQAAVHGRGELRPVLFRTEDILADPELVEINVSLAAQ